MRARTQNIAAGTEATFTIKKIADNSTLATQTASTGASSVEATWVSQKPSDDWGNAEIKFSVAAGGVSANSEGDQLSFHQYADIASVYINQYISSTPDAVNHPTVRYGWYQKVEVELDDGVLKIHVPIIVTRRQGMPPKRRKREDYGTWRERCNSATMVGDGNLSAADKTAYKDLIEGIYRRQMALHRTGCGRHSEDAGCPDRCSRKCCRLEIEVVVDLHDRGTYPNATEVNLWQGEGRANSSNWYTGDWQPAERRNYAFAHEVGHLMGFFDEYEHSTPPAWGPAGSSWQHPNAGALMDYGTRLETYYFDEYATWLGDASRTGEGWAVVAYS
jgi:hypothetical protein